MSPPAIPIRATTPRDLLAVLTDLREARRDYDHALEAMRGGSDWFDADDRAAEADQRLENLRDEFTKRLWDATGVTFDQLRGAFAEALI